MLSPNLVYMQARPLADTVRRRHPHLRACFSTRLRYLSPGNVTSVSPDSGQVGTDVTIRGVDLLGGGRLAAEVLLANVTATVLEASDTEIIVTASSSGGMCFPRLFPEYVAALVLPCDRYHAHCEHQIAEPRPETSCWPYCRSDG